MDNTDRFWDCTSALDKWIFAYSGYPRWYSGFLKVQSYPIDYKCISNQHLFSRYRNGELPEHVASLSVADTWITHLAFSNWTLVHTGCCKQYLTKGFFFLLEQFFF